MKAGRLTASSSSRAAAAVRKLPPTEEKLTARGTSPASKSVSTGRPPVEQRGTGESDWVAAQPKNKGKKPAKAKKDQDRARRAEPRVLVIIASGYPPRAGPRLGRHATTEHFAKSANTIKNAVIRRANNVSEFFGAIQGVNVPIKRVIFIGHGYRSGIRFAKGNESSSVLEEPDFDSQIFMSAKPQILKNLLKNAKIDLYACNTGVKREFMRAMANAFERTVRGFDELIVWCTENDGSIPHGKIMKISTAQVAGFTDSNVDCQSSAWKKLTAVAPDVLVTPSVKKTPQPSNPP